MEEESAVSSTYRDIPSLTKPRSGISSRSESKRSGAVEQLPLRTISLGQGWGNSKEHQEKCDIKLKEWARKDWDQGRFYWKKKMIAFGVHSSTENFCIACTFSKYIYRIATTWVETKIINKIIKKTKIKSSLVHRINKLSLVIVFIESHPLKMEVEPVAFLGLQQPMAAQVATAAMVTYRGEGWGQDASNSSISNPSSTRYSFNIQKHMWMLKHMAINRHVFK